MKRLVKTLKIIGLIISLLLILVISFFGYRDIPLEDLKEKYGQAPSSFISIDGLNVHFRDEGDSQDSIPIVLIHGTGSSLHTYDDWTKRLKRDYRVIRMDLPGYGLTGPFPDRNYSIKNYIAFLKHFLVTIGVKKCILAGNSLGGGISWNFTSKYPEMVSKLILIDASGYPFKAKSLPLAFKVAKIPVLNILFTFITPKFIAKSSVKSVFSNKNLVTDSLINRYFDLTLREGNRQAFVDRLNANYEKSNFHEIKKITHRTLILWGEKDELIPKEMAYQFNKDLPNDTLVIMKNVGHVPMEESPKESLKAVISFLKNS